MTKFKVLIALLSAWLVCSAIPAFAAGETAPEPFDKAFGQMVVIPQNFQGKAFVKGQMTDLYGDHRIVQREGRILVPIRLMSTLATELGQSQGYWDTKWDPQHPNDVILSNYQANKTIKFTVNSTTMLVNKEPHTMDVPPQKIAGQIMLPLRSAAEALDKEIQWWDGLILMGDRPVNLQDPQASAAKDRIKALLTDRRKPIDYTESLNPITKYGDAAYYVKKIYKSDETIDQLFRKADGQKETQVKLPGKPHLSNAKIINHELYYVSIVNDQAELYALDLVKQQSRKVCSLHPWKPDDGWLGNIELIDNELYVILHDGDNTMGGDTLYKVDNGALTMLNNFKSIIRLVKSEGSMYITDFRFMNDLSYNISRVDLKTGEWKSVGQQGFAYSIYREQDPQGGTSYTSSDAMYVQDGYLYTLGYKDSDPNDRSAVYKINPADQKQVKLTPPARDFWLVGSDIYYIDAQSGRLGKTDVNGERHETAAARTLTQVQYDNGSFYYLAKTGDINAADLYRYDPATGKETKLSEKSVASFFVGKAGIYYLSNGYDRGLYKVDQDGKNVRLVDDRITNAVLADDGMVYTLTYEKGIYSVK